LDILWVLIAAILVFVMQAGFLCLESGFVRSKNSINVAAKNIADFAISSAVFWTAGFALMFGESFGGLIGTSHFFFGVNASPLVIAIFLFQMMFCGTTVTLVSGAVAERMTFFGYLIIALTITLCIYPVIGHWAWAGIISGEATGWLEKLGFVDFAGSTVVHSVGGWVSLAAILVIGPRIGRFSNGNKRIPGSNLPLAVLGCLLIWFGWFGFNGGSTFGWTDAVPGILLNTCLAAFWGGIAATTARFFTDGYIDVQQIVNGILGGLVSITASCHVVSPPEAALIGLAGGVIVNFGDAWLEKLRIDDSVGVIPVHLFAGIWGTLAVALFGDTTLLNTGLSGWQQAQAQIIGIVVIGCYSFAVSFMVFKLVNRFYPLRVSPDAELMGLNVSEHRVSTEVFDLLFAMQEQQQAANFSSSVPVEPFTEVGQIAQQYNRVIKKVDEEIKQRDEAFLAFRQSEYRNGAILNTAMDCIISINELGEVLEFNPAAEQCFGISKRFVSGQVFFNLYLAKQLRNAAMQSLSQGFMLSEGLVLKRTNVTELYRSNGEKFQAEVVITRTTDSGDPLKEYTLHIRDITKQIKLQDRLRYLAYHDPLTGLCNRSYFVDNMKKRIIYHQSNPGAVVLMFIDLDQFKKINDTLGHKAGDELLCQVANRLNSVVRDVDLVGRWGGDEFVIAMSGDVTTETAFARADSVLEKMRQPVVLNGQSLTVLSSVGIAISEQGDISADRLLHQADLAMYRAKQAGRDNYQLFTDDLEVSAHQKFQFEFAIPEAISNDQLLLHYQPKVACDSNTIIGFEALLRWQHPEQGFIPPGDFIPIIEESNLIINVGEWVLEAAFKQLLEWKKQALPLLPIAVNISGRHLYSPTLAPFIASMTKKYGIPSQLIELELTEGVLIDESDQSIAAMSELKKLDIRLSIDDFGTGYSSLSYLKRFPIDTLKIDRAFVIECHVNNEDGAICTAIIAVAKSIGLQTIAEGVETEEQLEFLKRRGCDAFQGFLFSRPVAAEYIPELLSPYSASAVNNGNA
jgi:Amt family ammonium transporter